MSEDHPLTARSVEEIEQVLAARRTRGTAAWSTLATALIDPQLSAQVDAAGKDLVQALARGGRLLVAGNGGSAAMAGHIAAEFTGKCVRDREPLPALSLADSLTAVTAIGNDYGFDQIFSRGVAAHGRAGDVLLAMSTSGASHNIRRALQVARERGLRTILLTGSRGAGAGDLADHLLVVPSDETPRIQEVHLLWTHAWCEAADVLGGADDG